MTELPGKSIADRVHGRLAWQLALGAALWGVMASLVYWQQELTLSHYDARGHLVVARRVVDSLTPGWLQVGAVWLPLPHVLNLLPAQVDAWYRTGASGVALSILSIALLVYSTARLVLRQTGAPVAAVLAALVTVTNPNVLYLQSTPMTEPLLLGLLAWALWLVTRAMELDTPRARLAASVVLAMAVMTRYEAWPFAVAVLAAVPVASWHAGRGWRRGLTAAGAIAMWPVAACLWFFVHSKVTVGSWFVTGGFYVPDPAYQFQPLTVTGAVWWGLRQLGSEALAYALVASVALIGTWWWRHRMPSTAVLALAWLAVGALPWYAFFQGHPFRIRYMIPLVVGSAAVVSLAVGRLPRGRALVAAALLAGIWWTSRPFDRGAAMVLEAQWDRPRSLERRAVTRCLPAPGGDETVMASMGSLAHYMHELSASGFALRDFLHEGNGDLWLQALERPGDYVRWVLVEERAEGGDMLALRAAGDPAFLAGFTRLCEGGGVALYGLQ